MAKSGVTLPGLKKSGITGIKEMRDTVGKLLDKTSANALKGVFLDAAQVLRDRLYATVPGPSVGNKAFPAGTLGAGIFMSPGKDRKANVLVGIGNKGGANHLGLWLEYGTSKMSPRPFFRPAVQASKPQMAQIVAEGIRDAIDGATH